MYPNASHETQQYQGYQYHQVRSSRSTPSNLPTPEGHRPNNILQNPQLQISHIQPRESPPVSPQSFSRSPFPTQPLPYQFSSVGGYNMASPPAARTNDPSALETQRNSRWELGSPDRGQRHSIQHTPIEMQATAFSPAARRPSEPAIPQSPVSLPPDSCLGPEARGRTSPYRVQSLPHPHPQNFPSVLEDPQESTHPQSPGPLPVKAPRDSLPSIVTGPDSTSGLGATFSPTQQNPTRESVQQAFGPTPSNFTPIYDPYSSIGPNGLMTAAHRPGQVAHPNMTLDNDEWGHSICECGDVPTCCLGCWCPCMLYGKTQYRLTQKSAKKDPTDLLGYKACNGPCGLMCLLCGFQWALAFFQHTRVRNMYNVKGSCARDCVTAGCCLPCVLIQDEREVRDREDERRRQAGPASAIESYIMPERMHYAPQQGR